MMLIVKKFCQQPIAEEKLGNYFTSSIGKSLFVVIGVLMFSISYGQDLEVTQIRAQRDASNQALRNFDEDLNASYSTDDSFITTGVGKLIAGKEALSTYLKSQKHHKMYWVRTPDEVIVNPNTKLAWETGIWKGYYENSETSGWG